MNYLSYLTPVSDAEITFEKLDKAAKTLSERIRKFAKFFGIVLIWCVFNFVVTMFFSRERSFLMSAYRLINDGLRNLAPQDLFFLLTFVVDDKIGCLLSIAMVVVFGVSFFVRLLNLKDASASSVVVNDCDKNTQTLVCDAKYIVSYKQQVAFLA